MSCRLRAVKALERHTRANLVDVLVREERLPAAVSDVVAANELRLVGAYFVVNLLQRVRLERSKLCGDLHLLT